MLFRSCFLESPHGPSHSIVCHPVLWVYLQSAFSVSSPSPDPLGPSPWPLPRTPVFLTLVSPTSLFCNHQGIFSEIKLGSIYRSLCVLSTNQSTCDKALPVISHFPDGLPVHSTSFLGTGWSFGLKSLHHLRYRPEDHRYITDHSDTCWNGEKDVIQAYDNRGSGTGERDEAKLGI